MQTSTPPPQKPSEPAISSSPNDAIAEEIRTPTRSAPGKPLQNVLKSFGCAFAGLSHLLRRQRNARIHCAFAALAIALGIWLRISATQWAIIALTIGVVLSLEAMNTAIEAVVDLIQPQMHPRAKTAKDVAAAMVLIAAIVSLAVGAAIFLPLLYIKLRMIL